MSTLEETLRKSRQVQEQYLKFLKDKEKTDKSWKQTEERIDRTISKISQTKESIAKVDKLYQNYLKSFDDMVNAAVQKIQKHKLLEKAAEDFQPIVGHPKKTAQLLRQKKKIMILTGAGLSSASGIPTFRDVNGFWTTKKQQNIQPQVFLTLENFEQNPSAVWQWIQNFYCIKEKCKPNIGHACLDAFCENVVNNGHQVCIVTQNIDNFHIESRQPSPLFKNQKQNTYSIYEIHGNVTKIRCDKCSSKQDQIAFYPYEDFRRKIVDGVTPLCPKCQEKLRPHIMFFDEFYTQKTNKSEQVKNFCVESDILLVIGTALQTGLARMLVESFLEDGKDIIQINTECIIKQPNTIWFEGKSEEFLVKICNEYY